MVDRDLHGNVHNVIGKSVVIDEPLRRKHAVRKFRYFSTSPAVGVLDYLVDVPVEFGKPITVDYFVDAQRTGAVRCNLGTEVASSFTFRPNLGQHEPEQVIVDLAAGHQLDRRDNDPLLEYFPEGTARSWSPATDIDMMGKAGRVAHEFVLPENWSD